MTARDGHPTMSEIRLIGGALEFAENRQCEVFGLPLLFRALVSKSRRPKFAARMACEGWRSFVRRDSLRCSRNPGSNFFAGLIALTENRPRYR
jgi:hypothetical protein